MREDMFKIIVERPRSGWRSRPRARHRLAGEDDLPAKIGMRRHIAVTRQKSKWLNENLQPLKRYLGQQVGRPWDKVFSEIAATLAPGHTVKEHVRSHLGDFVARTVMIGEDGELTCPPGHKRYRPSVPWHQIYYVDPRDGLLKDSAKLWKKRKLDPHAWRRREDKNDPNVRTLGPMRELRRIEGIWYEIGYDERPDTDMWAFDMVRRIQVSANTRHAIGKRQLARPELMKFGLINAENN
jgi:hypothetical protein